MNTDPLEDSDDEGDENARLDLRAYLSLLVGLLANGVVAVVRLRIINRLRGKAPTPEPESHRPMHYAH